MASVRPLLALHGAENLFGMVRTDRLFGQELVIGIRTRLAPRWQILRAPESFNGPNDSSAAWMREATGEKFTDIEANREDFDIVGFDLEADNALIFYV